MFAYMYISLAALDISWELDVYTFNEGENAIFEICAAVDVNETIPPGRVETRMVFFRNDTATGIFISFPS